MQPAVILGVPLMDTDHAVVEALFERVATTDDAHLPALFAELEAEVIAHFAREEVLMDSHDAPVAHCHKAQHRLLLGEFATARRLAEVGSEAELRRTIAMLAEFVAGHVASVDRVTAQFIGGTLSPESVAKLRLPADHC